MTRLTIVAALMAITGCATLPSGQVMGANDSLAASTQQSTQESSAESTAQSSSKSTTGPAEPGNSFDQSSQQSIAQSSKNSSGSQSMGASSAVLLSTVAIGATAAIVGIVIWSVTQPKPGTRQAGQIAYDFLRMNRVQLQQDLAIGSGPFLDDLANAAEIRPEHRSAFGRVLREHREELLTLALNGLTPDQALTFLTQVGVIARSVPALASDATAFGERHPDAG